MGQFTAPTRKLTENLGQHYRLQFSVKFVVLKKHLVCCLNDQLPQCSRSLIASYHFTTELFNFQDLIVHFPLQLLHISLQISYENLVLDHDNNFYLITLSILITCLMDNERILLVVVVLCVYLTDHLCCALHCFHVF